MKFQQSVSFSDTSIAFSSKSDKELKKMHFLFRVMNYPLLVNLGTNFLKVALKLNLPVKSLIKRTIFEQFCGGETIYDCRDKSLELSKYGIDTILDYSVEGTEDEADFEQNAREILDVIDKSGIAPKNPFVVFKFSGIASNAIMKKLQNKQALSSKEQNSWQTTRKRLKDICEACNEEEVKVLIDAEESWIQDVIDEQVYELMEQYNQENALVYNTYQMYRKDMLVKLREAHRKANSNGYHLGAKLVRGAYMEKERDRAKELGYPNPIHPDKQATDEDFNRALKYCVENIRDIGLCCGSHNEYSNLYLTELMDEFDVERHDPRIYFAQLYGMSDNISFNLANAGYNVAKYLPYGPVEDVIPYLFRRAEENTAIAGQSSRELSLVKKEISRRAAESRRA
ncbi:MAG: proline dehydrogenase [Cyclobacteriaceae bacterium]|nr:MAG: proline dehydrogenase [Cyclobacteriaceae bacterium]